MEIDQTTLQDLSIFNADEANAVFELFSGCLTINGRDQLRKNLQTPLSELDAILGVQNTLKKLIPHTHNWPAQISNGTIKVVERFYESSIDPLPATVSSWNAYTYKLLHGPDYSLIKYTMVHCFDFIKGMQWFVENLSSEKPSAPLVKWLKQADAYLQQDAFGVILKKTKSTELLAHEMLQLGMFIRHRFKHQMAGLLQLHAQLDAWYGMATAIQKNQLIFPDFKESLAPHFIMEGLYHPLLANPVSYDIQLNHQKNFLFLTGANMAGKSTFIKSVGIAVFLAHAGMGVPAVKMELSLFDGILSNINVQDNLAKGESYFFNEVQRIKATISKINDGRKWLILIDELFKGTNVQDAMKCSSLVIEGLMKIRNSLFILSTHLYEIGEDLKVHPNIQFSYFETAVDGDQLVFPYQLKAGISDDRFGYLILKKEGVVHLLNSL